jgi:GxxExxY protein
MQDLLYEELSGLIRQTAFEAHCYFGNGFLEKVYENALAHRLRKKGLTVLQQVKLAVCDEDGTVVGDYIADLIVNDSIIIEVKAVTGLTSEHMAQTINYLKTTGRELGLLINFGQQKIVFKRLIFNNARHAYSAHSAHSVVNTPDATTDLQ